MKPRSPAEGRAVEPSPAAATAPPPPSPEVNLGQSPPGLRGLSKLGPERVRMGRTPRPHPAPGAPASAQGGGRHRSPTTGVFLSEKNPSFCLLK